MAMTDWTIIRRSMSARMFSTVTTVLTVAVAIGLMLVLLSMRDAGQRAFERGGGNMQMVLSAEPDPMTVVLNNVFYSRVPRQYIEWGRYESLVAAYPLEFAVPIQQGDSFKGFPVLATTNDFFTKFEPVVGRKWETSQGRFFGTDFEAVLGAAVARATGLKVGDKIVLTHGTPDSRAGAGGEAPHEHAQFKYTVVGVLAPTGSSHDRGVFTNLESAWIIHAHDRIERKEAEDEAKAKEAARLAAPSGGETAAPAEHDHENEAPTTAADLIDSDRKITGVFVRVHGGTASTALQSVFNAMRKEPGITVASPSQEIGNLFRIIGNINQILVGMAAVVMVSSGIAIMLALYNSMEQRRRQIAVLRVLGCSRPRVFGLVLTESAVLGVIGAAAGVVLAAGGGWAVAMVMRQRLGLVVDPRLSPVWIVAVGLGTLVLAAAAGVVPAVMAYRTSVARNLRPLG